MLLYIRSSLNDTGTSDMILIYKFTLLSENFKLKESLTKVKRFPKEM